MDRLSSCYFCGTALDASLSEYPVVPKDLHPDPDQQRSVVLCPTCRRKLATVVETVVGAIDGAEADVGEESDADAGAARDDAGRDDGWEFGATGADADDPEPGDPESTSGADDQSPVESDTRSTEGTDDQSADGGDGGTMTALEYNKVMRLLQNREFPVDRAEIREVAVNAYDLSPDEFEAVIEAAVSRGLIAEEDGQFVAAE